MPNSDRRQDVKRTQVRTGGHRRERLRRLATSRTCSITRASRTARP